MGKGVTLQFLVCSVSSGGIGVGVGQWDGGKGGWREDGLYKIIGRRPFFLMIKAVFQPFSVTLQSTPFNPSPLSPHPGFPPPPPPPPPPVPSPYPGFGHLHGVKLRNIQHVAIYMELNCATFSMWPSTWS